ncbi:hypothetical protein [Myxococcus sp. Y35]|uniref:hypothetical protein n=1 Tax=Pseudomyxococcus flavus TaxID=3115648 RepID=UPI003CF20578
MQHSIRSLICCALLAAVAGAGAPAHARASSEAEASGGVIHEIREIFRGLILADGVVAESIPELRDNFSLARLDLKSEHLKLIQGEYDVLIELIDERDPEFFEKFGELIFSRDEEKIALALYQGNRVLAEAIRMRDWHGLDIEYKEEALNAWYAQQLSSSIEPVLGEEVATIALTNLGSAVGRPQPDDPGPWPPWIGPYIHGNPLTSVLIPYQVSLGVDYSKAGGLFHGHEGALVDVSKEITAGMIESIISAVEKW